MSPPEFRKIGAALATVGVVIASGCARTGSSEPLPALGIDPKQVTVSGFSSGAYMAQQVHFALNERVTGAGLIAGGPYGCARGNPHTALSNCMAPQRAPDVAALAVEAKERAAAGRIAPSAAFIGDRAWVFHGSLDHTVNAMVTEASAAIYREMSPSMAVVTETGITAAHTFPTLDQGGDCAVTVSPYIGRCGYDAVATLLASVLDLPPAPPAPPQGRLIAVDQRAFDAPDAPASMDDNAWLYIPPRCEAGGCRLHIAFHGCEQSQGTIGRAFVDRTGYTGHADHAGVVVLFPQARASFVPLNPKGCWDWWGYTGPDYDTRDGAQIRVVAAMIDRLAQVPPR